MLLGRGARRQRGEKALRVGDPPDGEAFDDDVLLVRRQILRARRSGKQQAPVQARDAVEWRFDVETSLIHDADDAPEAHHHTVFGDVDGEERGNARPDQKGQHKCRQRAPHDQARSFVGCLRSLFGHRRVLARFLRFPTCSRPCRTAAGATCRSPSRRRRPAAQISAYPARPLR